MKITRRSAIMILAVCCLPVSAATKRFRYKIKTKSGQIIGGTQQATDAEQAKVKILARYPEAQFLSLQEE